MSLSLLVGIWVTRYLGPQQYGTLTYAATFMALFSPIAKLGLDSIVVREVAQDPDAKDEILGTAFFLKLFAGFVTLLLSVAAVSLASPGDALARTLVAIFAAGLLFQAFETIDFWFNSQLQSRKNVVARSTALVTASAIRIALILLHAPLVAFAVVGLVEVALGAISLVAVFKASGQSIRRWRLSIPRAKRLMRECLPLVLAGVSVYIYSKADQMMLGALLKTKSELGYYSTAVRLAELFDFVPMVLQLSFLPRLSELKATAEGAYAHLLQFYFDLMLITWLLVAILISTTAPFLVPALFGSAYAPAAPILSLYVWGQFGCNLGIARSTFMIVEKKAYLTVPTTLIGAILNVGLNFYLIPRHGAMGATAATLVTYFLIIIGLNFVYRDLRPVNGLLLNSLNFFQVASRLKERAR